MPITPIVSRTNEPEIHRAGWLICDSETLIENGCVQVHHGRIIYSGVFRPDLEGQVHDHGPGLLIPALVNAHTHLELSALKGQVDTGQGFGAWVKELLARREQTPMDTLIQGGRDGIRELIHSGTLVVGDVSTLGISTGSIQESDLSGVVFQEYLGNAIPDTDFRNDQGGIYLSLAGHAPHTSSPELLCSLKKQCRAKDRPFSIHLSESIEEMEFMTTGKGNWAEFLSYRGIDFSSWGIPCQSPITHLDRLGLLDDRTLCVHVIRADDHDLDLIRQNNAWVCLCPRSNDRLHQTLPPVKKMQAKGLSLCLGTDSLASTPTLRLQDEMAFLAAHIPGLDPKEIFRMATENGARALNLGKTFGRLEPGMSGTLAYVNVSATHKQDFFECIYDN